MSSAGRAAAGFQWVTLAAAAGVVTAGVATAGVATGAAVLTVALALAAPLPRSIHDLQVDRDIALCPLAVHR